MIPLLVFSRFTSNERIAKNSEKPLLEATSIVIVLSLFILPIFCNQDLILPAGQFSFNILLNYLYLRFAQDIYHLLAHSKLPGLKWLSEWHWRWHHLIYSSEYNLRVSVEELCKAHWFNEVPEAVFMLIAVLGLMIILWLFRSPFWWSAAYGLYHVAQFHLIRAIRIGLGDINLWYKVTPEHQTASTANSDNSPFFKEPPSRWRINALYHLRHHDGNPNAYYCAMYPWLDWFLGTSYHFSGLKFEIVFAEVNSNLAVSLQAALPLNERKISLIKVG